ncbi:hypothetical protein FACS1894151_09210 [Spirochaetia bacterium]|nr:hypothetical protein FACS1894151_09210 [Spirochaetia bacterium]
MPRKIVMFQLMVLLLAPVYGQRINSMDFRNQSIVDILMVLADISGTSIVCDDTVSGNASFHFSEADLEESLALFLSNYRLHYMKDGNIIRVSRIYTGINPDSGGLDVKADDVPVENLIKALARVSGTTILYDSLPAVSMSVNIEGLNIRDALGICMSRLPGFSLEEAEHYYYIRHIAVDSAGSTRQLSNGIVRSGETYSIGLENGRFFDILSELFSKSSKEYSLLTRTDSVLERLYFTDKTFDEMLRLILEQGNADYAVSGGIYYILELQRRDITKKLRETEIISLEHISAQELPSLLPSELAAGNLIKVDRNSNTVFLTGTEEEISPVRTFIKRIDNPAENYAYRRYELIHLNVNESLALIPRNLLPVAPVIIPSSNAFLAYGTPQTLSELEKFLEMIDTKKEGYPISLKYIRTEDLLRSLPPSVSSEEIKDSGYPNLVFFTGPNEKREYFMRELLLIDRPRPQLRYELLVIEYLDNSESRFSRNMTAEPSAAEEENRSFMGSLSNILNISFDIVAQFGYQFAANLSYQLGNNTAVVYADTTLNGLSGQEIKFQNTDTYRYQEFEVDPDTGNIQRSGVTREITSGLIVALNGWVSGDDMITVSVNATISKQNNNSSSTSSGIPSTSERVVNTQVRTPSGRPIVLSGLIKEDSNINTKKLPLLGDIPVLGYLFKDEERTHEKTEIVIYIVPYLSGDENEEYDVSRRIERYYNTFIQNKSR